MVGTIFDPDLDAFRAIQFRPPYDEPILLDPIQGDTYSGAFGINKSGKTLGSSWIETYEPEVNMRHGIWDLEGNLTTYFEGAPFILFFNDKNLIVLTANFAIDINSYLVPRPGVRFNLEELIDNPAASEAPFVQVVDINNRGDILAMDYVKIHLARNFCCNA